MSEFRDNIEILWSSFINTSKFGNVELAKKLIDQYEVEPNYDYNQAINVASMNKQDEMVKFLAGFYSVQEEADGMTKEELIDLFIPSLDHIINFGEDYVVKNREYMERDDTVRVFWDGNDSIGPYNLAYIMFLRRVKEGTNSRIYTIPDDADEEYPNGEQLNGFGDYPN